MIVGERGGEEKKRGEEKREGEPTNTDIPSAPVMPQVLM